MRREMCAALVFVTMTVRGYGVEALARCLKMALPFCARMPRNDGSGGEPLASIHSRAPHRQAQVLKRQRPATSAGLHQISSIAASSGLAGDLLAERRLRGGEARDRHTIGRARHVVHADLVAERDRGRIAAMLAADADLEVGPRGAAADRKSTRLN